VAPLDLWRSNLIASPRANTFITSSPGLAVMWTSLLLLWWPRADRWLVLSIGPYARYQWPVMLLAPVALCLSGTELPKPQRV